MGTFVEISDEFKADFLQATTEFFNYQTTLCTLNYPPIDIPCSNPSCSTNHNVNGTEYNSLADCYACGGRGNIASVVTDTINLVVFWHPSQWKQVISIKQMNIRVPEGSILVQGLMADLPKLRKADSILFNAIINSYQGGEFELFGEPVDQNNILKNNFFWAFLTRVPS